MSSYAQTYTTLLHKIDSTFLPHNNLLHLKHYRSKTNCYKQNPQQPDLYYDCFQALQIKIAQDKQSFTNNYHFIQDEYKACEKSCLASYTGDDAVRKACSDQCGKTFSKASLELYDSFYRQQLGNQSEYKKIKK